LQNHDMLVAQKFIENVYYHELARELREFGYAIENKPRGDFEIQGISPDLIEKFSKRHREIDQKTKELLAKEPENARENIAAIQAVARERGYIRDQNKPGRVTIREHLQREWAIVCAAKDGRFKFAPFQSEYRSNNRQLDDEQRRAVEGIMVSRGFVTLFRGGAGTGKSFTLREVQRELQKTGRFVQVVAPQRQQVLDLESAGFDHG